MANPQFPTLSVKIDSSKYGVDQEDPSMSTKMEGGYVVSRARHTRRPRRTFSCAYTEIRDADRALLTDFYDMMKGGSVVFDWLNPEENLTYAVRFKGSLKREYVGKGALKMWNFTFTLEEA